MRSLLLSSLAWGSCLSLVQAAINIDGSHAVKPATEDHDPSPIGDIDAYDPDQHDCPLPCEDFANMHSWTPYVSVERLNRCKDPMLLQFSVTQPLDDPQSSIYIRSCTINGKNKVSTFSAKTSNVDNPKKTKNLYEGGSLRFAPACAVAGTEVRDQLQLAASSGGGNGNGREAAALLQGMAKFFKAKDNCNEKFLFAYHKQTVASVYIGAGLGKTTASSALEALASTLQSQSSVANHTVAELCSSKRKPQSVFGIFVDTSGDLAAVQKSALAWSQGSCAIAQGGDLKMAGDLTGVKVMDIAGANTTFTGNNTSTAAQRLTRRILGRDTMLHSRAVCRHEEVQSGDGCAALASRCGISGADFTKYNPGKDFCSKLQPGDYVCCSAGDRYTPPKPDSPKPGADGTCATHLIENGDSCDALAKQYGITTKDIEKWNKGKTWAWTECRDMLVGYNMCLSDGTPPMPPPQEGTACGPLVPGTKKPAKGTSLADLNPCPLKACCSNWGFCGVFPAHCDIHAPKDGGPGTKEKGFQNTCVSNCGNEIKKNSGPPAEFQRIGYYESFGLDRECLWLKAKNANTDGTYTHIHWGFAGIDQNTWKPTVNDSHKQWEDFKNLDAKKILSFGGWAYSTEPATYNIIRSAIINNREAFATNLAQFVKDEGIDGIDIDWEYPGAPDIFVGGSPIGQKSDGIAYYKFLTVLKQKLGPDKSVSIAAPASYWYLKAFPIDRIASVIDYIVYMTYDLHGQWDYGNPNAFDSCGSGKCIRSHVNLTETRNALSMITKAGVPNNKIFVGESSYGRAFHMAQNGCWGPDCDFTGSRTQSDAAPGRCTKTGGYLSNAEINEIITRGDGVEVLHDGKSNTDVLLYKGDYVSYMTPTTKDTRREDWKGLNFGGTIDWAVDLQEFTNDDFDNFPEDKKENEKGEVCVAGEDISADSGDLCEFTCELGFCPESHCECITWGSPSSRPKEDPTSNAVANDGFDVDLNRLCKFACKYGFCPENICQAAPQDWTDQAPVEVGDDPNYFDYEEARWQNAHHCLIYKDPEYRDASVNQCKPICQQALDEAAEENRISNYGCVGFFPLAKEIPWERYPGTKTMVAPGECNCDNMLVNEIAQFVLDAMPIIAQIGCYILMSSFKFVLDVGAQFIPGVGKALDAGLDMATTAAQMASYIYPEEEDPEAAFSWWLSPCGGTDLVPDDIKKVFNILNTVADGVSSFKPPKNIKKGSGKKGDDGNPRSPTKPRPNTGGSGKPGNGKPGGGGKPGNGGIPNRKKKCFIPPGKSTQRLGGGHTLRMLSCDKASKTQTTEMVITSVKYAKAVPTQITAHCEARWNQACYHYRSAISVNTQWETLTCPQEAATVTFRKNAKATGKWLSEHSGKGWKKASEKDRAWQAPCDMDEYPPANLLGLNDPARTNAGLNKKSQRVRLLPHSENRGAGSMWKGTCFNKPVEALSDKEFARQVLTDKKKKSVNKKGVQQTHATATVDQWPEFTITSWGVPKNTKDDALWDNKCWPKGIAAGDPGYTLLSLDDWYDTNPPNQNPPGPKYKYNKEYKKGSNGS
ncbi:hypothetical protein QQS21_005356 [Conoideocrella luteorostrata]|uniref:chitinase n=1 Tax=Conoideocrella luteorostrata TaxID=1105319 RepID=A0AAJ0FZ28_9HYPO|nr:hypothetical protein QQS21_005356 [Conoideocrella luteorostrata]